MYTGTRILAGLAAAVVFAGLSNASSITASGAGYCSITGSCDNTNINAVSNSYAEGGAYNDWYAFMIPNLGTITSATLTVANNSNDTTNSSAATYVLYQETGFSFSGLIGGGTPLGQITVSS